MYVDVHLLDEDRHGYVAVLRERTRGSCQRPRCVPGWIAEAASLAAHGLRRWHYAEPGVLLETFAFDRGISGPDGRPVDRQAMHVGWVSGIPWAYALLRHGRRVAAADHIAAAGNVIDFICADLSPSGTFWGLVPRSELVTELVPGPVRAPVANPGRGHPVPRPRARTR